MSDPEKLSRELAERFEPDPVFDKPDWETLNGFVSHGGWWRLTPMCETIKVPRSHHEPDRVVWMLKKLFVIRDTSEWLEDCGEDTWTRLQRRLYHAVSRKLDCDVPFEALYADALAQAMIATVKE